MSELEHALPGASTREQFRLGYRPWLDGIRGLGFLAVFAFHTRRLLPFKANTGITSIETFFVLSGFLITVLLLEEQKRTGTISLKAFYIRRARRLLPALTLLLIGVCVLISLDIQGVPRHKMSWAVLAVAGYVGNFVRGLTANDLGVLGHTWSLSVEEQFYLLFPIAFVFMLRRRMSAQRMALLMLGGAVLSVVWREIVRSHGTHTAETYAYCGLDTRGYALLLGCAAGVIMHAGLQPLSQAWQRGRGALAALAALFLATYYLLPTAYPAGYTVYLTLVAVATFVIILHLASTPVGLGHRFLSFAPFVQIGRLSYGLYLAHFPVTVLLTPQRAHIHGLPLAVLDAAITAALALASWHLVEKRFIRRRSAKDPGPTHTPATAA